MTIKNPILKKIIAIALLSSAGWIIFVNITEPTVEKYLTASPLIAVLVAVGLVVVAFKLLGGYIRY